MIASIRLRNFQSHKDTIIHFHEGVNAIVGPSDSGKSAIFRGLNWVVNNRPTGDEFQSNWGGDTEVTLKKSDGTMVTRRKGKSENVYEIRRGRKVQTFKAFGQDVPAEVRGELNLNETNLQSQMEGLFLLSMSPGDVAKFLNRAANLDSIDQTTSNIRKKKLEIDRTLKFEISARDDLKAQLEKYADLNQRETDVVVLEQLTGKRQQCLNDTRSIKSIVEQIKEQFQTIVDQTTLLDSEEEVVECNSELSRLRKLDEEKEELHQVFDKMFYYLGVIDEKEILIGAEEQLKETLLLNNTRESIEQKHAELFEVWMSLDIEQCALDDQQAILKRLEQEFSSLKPDICPLCGGKWKRN